jgi:hypothetical protein
MGQECNISVIYDRFFYADIPIFAIFAHPNNILRIFRSKNKKTFSHISKSALVAAHPAWPKMLESGLKTDQTQPRKADLPRKNAA